MEYKIQKVEQPAAFSKSAMDALINAMALVESARIQKVEICVLDSQIDPAKLRVNSKMLEVCNQFNITLEELMNIIFHKFAYDYDGKTEQLFKK